MGEISDPLAPITEIPFDQIGLIDGRGEVVKENLSRLATAEGTGFDDQQGGTGNQLTFCVIWASQSLISLDSQRNSLDTRGGKLICGSCSTDVPGFKGQSQDTIWLLPVSTGPGRAIRQRCRLSYSKAKSALMAGKTLTKIVAVSPQLDPGLMAMMPWYCPPPGKVIVAFLVVPRSHLVPWMSNSHKYEVMSGS